jgi:hypothetical protein
LSNTGNVHALRTQQSAPTWGQYSECHGLIRHAWHIVPSDWTPVGGEPFTVRCERCNTERRDTIGRNTGELVSRRYVYPDGYLYGRDDYKPTADEVRLMWVTRHIEQARQAPARKRGRSA